MTTSEACQTASQVIEEIVGMWGNGWLTNGERDQKIAEQVPELVSQKGAEQARVFLTELFKPFGAEQTKDALSGCGIDVPITEQVS